MSRPLSAHGHLKVEPYGRALVSPFGGYVHVPVPAPPNYAGHNRIGTDGAKAARTMLNPAKAAAGHSMMNTREYGTGGSYEFREAVRGVVPGYAGHRPGARDVHHKMAYGGVATFNDTRGTSTPPGQGARMGNRPTTTWQETGRGWKVPEERPNENFRDAVGGVLVGYTGFVPGARTHQGASHVGGLANSGARGHDAQRGHGQEVMRNHADKKIDMTTRTLRSASAIVGYQVRTAHPSFFFSTRLLTRACVHCAGPPALGQRGLRHAYRQNERTTFRVQRGGSVHRVSVAAALHKKGRRAELRMQGGKTGSQHCGPCLSGVVSFSASVTDW